MATTTFNRALAHLPVRNLLETLNYYKDDLGFSDDWTFGDKDGGVRRDDMRLLFFENPDHVGLINSDGNRLPVLWFVENIDEIFYELKERKIKIEDPLREHAYGLREFAFIDINGYYVRVAESKPKPDQV